MRRAGVGEALAHLPSLERQGVVSETPGEPASWALTDPAADIAG